VDKERPTYLIFLTDGLPTEGETDSERILANFQSNAPENLRLFVFGVGWDVDTYLLDSLSQHHRGLSFYVQPGEDLTERLSEFYTRISTPVLTGLELDFGTLDVYDLYPQPLPDLFSGTQVVLVGRYRNGGETDIVLHGDVNGVRQTFRYMRQSFDTDSRGAQQQTVFLPRLWATRKIGYLLNRIRLNGPDQETIDQIVRLSIRYGIVTPYTSYLVTEPMPLGVESQQRLAAQSYQELQAGAAAPVFGQDAVEKAMRQGALSQAEVAPMIPVQENQRQAVRVIGARTFVYSQDIWTDTAFDPDRMETQKVAFLSVDYFALANARRDIAAALAQAERVIVVVDGAAYQIVAENEHTGTVTLPEPQQHPASQLPIQPPAAISGAVDEQPEAQTSGRQQPAGPLTCLGGLLPLALILLVLHRCIRCHDSAD
ncbi:MAG: hypothetical protein ROW52_13845, partial [Anaerolineaceae bacterium]|jgi:Ca-activated chloride channel family protein